jgi:hypothetical protein
MKRVATKGATNAAAREAMRVQRVRSDSRFDRFASASPVIVLFMVPVIVLKDS